MTDPRQDVRPGQRLQIAAQQINFLNHLMRDSGGLDGPPLKGWGFSGSVVMAKNKHGQAVPRWGVMQIKGVNIDPNANATAATQFGEMPCLEIDLPAVDDPQGFPVTQTQRICIAIEPIAPDAIGRVLVSGVAPVQITGATEGMSFATAIHGEHGLRGTRQSNAPAKVLWANEVGQGWGLVQLNECGNQLVYGKTPNVPWLPNERLGINLYINGPNEPPAGGGIQAMNTLFHPIAGESWVVLWSAPDGDWYVVSAGKWDYECHPPVVAGHDLSQLPGYNATGTQLLGHEDGCLKWISTTSC